jgi:CheY-like chemotaxis protein
VMNPPRVLVIDDSPSICVFIANALQQAGYQVDVALSGREGFAKLMTFMPHCLILDVLLPDTNGYELCRYIRQNALLRRLPLILISSKNAPLDITYGLRQGADRYLSKPFTAEALIQEVWEIVPDPLRSTTHPAVPTVQAQRTRQTMLRLVPRQILRQDAMQASNPFAGGPAIKDRQARRLLSEIDGRKSVTRLATVTGLSLEEVIKALDVLLKANRIQLYDAQGQLVEEAL